ncbi:flagellar motor switch protein FliG [Sulfitobacter aestuarii]|uniref:Flagellar motor switch protein FliG n=1 Tax=Sulfitobacter aestuarii TaxID=2161676 RepID=A0ABW5U262_9RHOB
MVALGQRGTGLVAPGGAPPQRLSRKAKAAIVVRLLLSEGADIPLEELPEDLQASLTEQMGALRRVDRATLSAVVSEFLDELDGVGLSFSGGLVGALDMLDGKISKHTAARLRREARVRALGDPWESLCGLDADRLLPVLENESVEVAAVMLSKLPVATAAALLGRLPGPQARRITYAVSLTGAVTPEAVERIGLSLAAQLEHQPPRAFDADPVERVGAILNSSTSLTRDDVLEGLQESDEGFAEAVRRAIFTFANIPERVAPRDIPRILRAVDPGALLTALAGAEAAGQQPVADFILSNMSGRMADQLREDIGEAGKVKPAAAEEAMAAVVTAIRALEATGDVVLLSGEEDGEAG